jgi:hypothetical protein
MQPSAVQLPWSLHAAPGPQIVALHARPIQPSSHSQPESVH